MIHGLTGKNFIYMKVLSLALRNLYFLVQKSSENDKNLDEFSQKELKGRLDI